MKTIYYEYPSLSSFVSLDIERLSETHKIIQLSQQWVNKQRLVLSMWRQLWFLLRNYRTIDRIVISFAGYHSFLPVLFGRWKKIPVYIVLNGTDAVSIPELNYGSHRKRLLRYCCNYSVRRATELWPVSASLIEGHNTFTGQELHYGVRVSFPGNNTPFRVIPNGFDVDKWRTAFGETTRTGAITVVSGVGQFALKGVDLFLEAAEKHPEMPFTVVGMEQPAGMTFPINVRFTGRVPHTEMKTLFAGHRFYMQLSSFEGFGCSLCEAMLCGCIPIVSDVNALPEIIGDTGVVLKQKKVDVLEPLLNVLLETPEEQLNDMGRAAMEKIRAEYPIEQRIRTLEERMGW